MIPLDALEYEPIDLSDLAGKERTRRFIGMQSPGRGIALSSSTSALLQDLSQVSLQRIHADPLAAFDTEVGLVTGAPFFCEVDTAKRRILLSEKFLQAIEYAAAQASVVNIMKSIDRAFDAGAEDTASLKGAMAGARTAFHSLYVARMTLHILDEAPAPGLATLLPERHQKFVHQQTALCLIFALLHEQAHIVFAEYGVPEQDEGNHPQAFVEHDLTSSQHEELQADIWAVNRITGARRAALLRAASFFFFNQWMVDYLAELASAEHPPAFNRIQSLMRAIPDLEKSDIAFFEIMTDGLNQQLQLRNALNSKQQPSRYATFLKWCRSYRAYSDYEPLVSSVCQAYEEMRLDKKPIST